MTVPAPLLPGKFWGLQGTEGISRSIRAPRCLRLEGSLNGRHILSIAPSIQVPYMVNITWPCWRDIKPALLFGDVNGASAVDGLA